MSVHTKHLVSPFLKSWKTLNLYKNERRHLLVSVGLLHLGMNIEARVSKLSDLLGKKFDTFCILAEDDGLIDVQLGEERVQAVQFLSFLQVGVELGDSLERELLHQIYEFGVWHILLLERSNGHWVSS